MDENKFVITEDCIDVHDRACVAVCPVDCIHFEEGTDLMLFIDPEECIPCGACEPECPVNAIYPIHAVPDDQVRFVELNARWFSDRESARASVDEWSPPGAPPSSRSR